MTSVRITVSRANTYGTRESSSSNIDAKYMSIQYSDADRPTIEAKKKACANNSDETIKNTCEVYLYFIFA